MFALPGHVSMNLQSYVIELFMKIENQSPSVTEQSHSLIVKKSGIILGTISIAFYCIANSRLTQPTTGRTINYVLQ